MSNHPLPSLSWGLLRHDNLCYNIRPDTISQDFKAVEDVFLIGPRNKALLCITVEITREIANYAKLMANLNGIFT